MTFTGVFFTLASIALGFGALVVAFALLRVIFMFFYGLFFLPIAALCRWAFGEDNAIAKLEDRVTPELTKKNPEADRRRQEQMIAFATLAALSAANAANKKS